MRFFIRKRRSPPGVIIVALIDVLIVLLIFLMVTTSFKKPVAALNLALPESTQAAKPGTNDAPPLVVIIESNGVIRVGDQAKPVTPDELKQELDAAVAQNPKLKVSLSADKNAPFGKIVRVMDVAREAKITAVSAFTKPAAPAP
jgi:biopolymer transport protein ExbD